MDKDQLRLLRLALWWGGAVSCVVALAAGYGSITKEAILALCSVMAICVNVAMWDHGWLPRKKTSLLTVAGPWMVALITACALWPIKAPGEMPEPVIHIDPEAEEQAAAKPGAFTFNLVNTGLEDISHVQIFKTYFVASRQTDGTIETIPIGESAASQFPDSRFDVVRRHHRQPFVFDIPKHMMDMMSAYKNADNLPTLPFIDLMIHYERSSDGKPYCLTKVYGVSPDTNGEAKAIYAPNRRGVGAAEFPKGAYVLPIEEVEKYLLSEKPCKP